MPNEQKITTRFMFLNTGQHGRIITVLTQPQRSRSFTRSKLSRLLRRRGQGFQEDQEDQEVQGVRSLREYHLCQEALEDPEKQTEQSEQCHIRMIIHLIFSLQMIYHDSFNKNCT